LIINLDGGDLMYFKLCPGLGLSLPHGEHYERAEPFAPTTSLSYF